MNLNLFRYLYRGKN